MSIIIMILLLSILILVHEAGHFFTARMFGIRVTKFGFGLPIGPTLWEKQCGDTKILVHAFLLGGYVSFPDEDKDCDLPKDSPELFLNKPIYQRAVVVSAGVIANVICAIVFVFLTAFLWGHLPSGKYDVLVNNIVAEKTASVWNSGLQKNDRIAEINGTKIDNTYSLISIIQLSKKYDGLIDKNTVDKNLSELKRLNPTLTNDIISEGATVKLPERIAEPPIIFDEMTAKGVTKYQDEQFKLEDNVKKLRDELKDKNTYISNGKYTTEQLAQALSDTSHPLNITIERNGELINLKPVYAGENGAIGIQLYPKEILIPTTDIRSIVSGSFKYLYDNVYMMVYGLGQIFTGKVPLKDLHGIVAITKVGGDIIDNNGIFSGLLLIAIISMDLALINFLPIPALDGGHILFLLIEKLRGKPLEEEVIDKIGSIGFMFLIVLMVYVIFNDIFALVTKQL